MLGRRKLDKALAAHLERQSVSADFWFDSAKDAIAKCEAGDSVAPVFSGGGPIPARTVVVLLGLESFVERPIDFETPLLDGTERSPWFFPPNDDMVLPADKTLWPKIVEWFFPRGDEEGVRWIDRRLTP